MHHLLIMIRSVVIIVEITDSRVICKYIGVLDYVRVFRIGDDRLKVQP